MGAKGLPRSDLPPWLEGVGRPDAEICGRVPRMGPHLFGATAAPGGDLLSCLPAHPSPHRRSSMAELTLMDKLVSLCKRRGFVFQSSEIYGGLGSVWDYGPLGVELKRNVKDRWWNSMVHVRDDIEGLDAAILMHPKVWEASGHVAGFSDPMVDCKLCKQRFRTDQVGEASCPRKPSVGPGTA